MSNSTVNDTSIGHCQLFNGDTHKCDSIIAAKRTVACISLVGCLFIIFVICLFRQYVIFVQRMVLCLSLSAFLTSISYLIGDQYVNGPKCNFQAWLMTFWEWCVLLWICCITFNLYMCVVRLRNTEHVEWVFHVITWIMPLVISLLPFIRNHYGPAGVWCWVVNNWQWRIGIWYGPNFIILIALFIAYSYIVYAVKQKVKSWSGLHVQDEERNKRILHDEVQPLKWYPFIYLVLSVFPLVNRIQNAVGDNAVYELYILHVISSPLIGVAFAVLFGLHKETREKLTLSQIKAAFQSWRFRGKSEIRAYPLSGYTRQRCRSTSMVNLSAISEEQQDAHSESISPNYI